MRQAELPPRSGRRSGVRAHAGRLILGSGDGRGALEGGCFCGAVRYRVEGDVSHETACHCTICRRTSGAPFVAWFTTEPSRFRVVSGAPARLQSSDHGTRTFCGACGTPLTFQSSRLPDEIDVTTCSLDDPERAAPRDHTRTSAKLLWIALDDGLPRFPEERS